MATQTADPAISQDELDLDRETRRSSAEEPEAQTPILEQSPDSLRKEDFASYLQRKYPNVPRSSLIVLDYLKIPRGPLG